MFKRVLSSTRGNNYLKVLVFGFIIAFFVGCGGGSSSDNISGLNDAQFVDAPVAGLDYKTDSISGVTNNEGFFQYNSTDTKVSFYVGSLKIGEFNLSNLKSDKIILPADLFGLDRNNTTDDRLVKVIVFLQSLDSDNNPNNGITIDDNVKDKITDLLENNTTIKTSLSDNNYTVMEDIIKSSGKKMMLENIARDNYKEELIKLGYKPDFMPFTTVWEVNSSDLNIAIMINSDYLGEYNYTVDWGDGSIDKEVNDSITHTYANEGNYTVKIYGIFPAIRFKYNNYREKLLFITHWGDINWKSFLDAFWGCNRLNVITEDVPNLKNVTNMTSAFYENYINQLKHISDWNVSNITSMRNMFENARLFNQPLNDWNVSNVTDMGSMFRYAVLFNQPLNNWDVSHVSDMIYMFEGAESFNQPLDNWNVSNVVDMGMMFDGATSFDQNISDWNVSKVTDYGDFATGSPIDGTDKMPHFQ